MRNRLIRLVHGAVGALLVVASSVALGDDTDVYLNGGVGLPPGSEPMVMFSLDYRPNLGSNACTGAECNTLIADGYLPPVGPYTFFDVLRAALEKVMDPLEGVRVGLMLNHTHEAGCEGPNLKKCSNGGYIAMGFEPFVAGDANGAKAKFHAILDAMPTPAGGQSHSYQGKELFFEFFRYLTGQGIYNGHNGWTDYFTDNKKNLDFDGSGYDWDASIESGANYNTPLAAAGECTSIYTVNSMFFVSNQGNDSDPAIEDTVANGGFGVNVGNNDFAGVIGYLNDADLANGNYGAAPNIDGDQKVISYFLIDENAINKTSIGYAKAGGTGVPLELSQDPDELVRTLQDIFNQILSVSTTFVAASVPVNVFNRAEIVDNVYIALFQLDQDKKPAWVGNLKKLRLSAIDGTSLLVDALDKPAIAGDGRIRRDALTFWTDPWTLPPPDPDLSEVDQRDGRSVARGGAGQKLPGYVGGSPGLLNGPGNRRLFYDRGGSLLPMNVDAGTATDLQLDLNAATVGEAGELIAFARGNDIDDLDGDGDVDDARPGSSATRCIRGPYR